MKKLLICGLIVFSLLGTASSVQGGYRAVTAVAYAPDGKTFAVGDNQSVIGIWNAHSGARLFDMGSKGQGIESLQYSRDSRFLLAAGYSGSATLWDVDTGQLVLELEGLDDLFTAAYSPDGQTILTAGQPHIAILWDATSGEMLHTLEGHTDNLVKAIYAPDGSMILTASEDQTAKLWNATTGELLFTLAGHTEPLTDAAFFPDSKQVVTASEDTTIRLWDTHTGQLVMTLQKPENTEELWFDLPIWLAVTPDGTQIVVGTNGGFLWAFDATDGAPIYGVYAHDNGSVFALACSPDGQTIATGGPDIVKSWNAQTGAPLYTFPHNNIIAGIAFSPDSAYLLTGSHDDTATLWIASTGRALYTVTP